MDTADESPAQKQARIRRERREAKIKAGGSARLDKIASLAGRSTEPASTPSPIPQRASTTDDPEEVDISSHAYPTPPHLSHNAHAPFSPDAAPLNLFRTDPHSPFAPQGLPPDGATDPFAQILQHFMTQMPGSSGNGNGNGNGTSTDGHPPNLADLLNPGAQPPAPPAPPYSHAWKLVHALFALSLGLYALGTLPFSGSRLGRVPAAVGAAGGTGAWDPANQQQRQLFWIFATAELGLLSGRWVVEGRDGAGAGAGAGWLGTAARFLPAVWGRRIRRVQRYAAVWATVVEDAMVVVFVLGAAAWWKGEPV